MPSGPPLPTERAGRLTIGTRGSPLALAQTELARRALRAAHPGLETTVTVIRTTGDAVQSRRLAEIGGKGLFTREIDDALLEGRIDVAVHSLKDVPTWLPDGIVIGCCLEREDPRDAWIAREAGGPGALGAGAVVGTASLRRAAQLLHRRPDLTIVPLRGNVGTRLAGVAAGAVDATLLALAGLRRLGRESAACAVLEPEDMLPAVGQGTIALACRRGDDGARERLAVLDDPHTAAAAAAERAMLARLDGSCRTPIAGLARVAKGRLRLDGLVVRPDGSEAIALADRANIDDAAALGDALGARLAERAGADFFRR